MTDRACAARPMAAHAVRATLCAPGGVALLQAPRRNVPLLELVESVHPLLVHARRRIATGRWRAQADVDRVEGPHNRAKPPLCDGNVARGGCPRGRWDSAFARATSPGFERSPGHRSLVSGADGIFRGASQEVSKQSGQWPLVCVI